jgi:drug/metabolite transporter (DMT)-like permease
MKSSSATLFVLLALIWGASYTFIKVSIDGLTAPQVVLFRLVLGAAFLLLVVRLRRVALPRWGSVWGHMALTAVLGMVAPFFLLAWGEQHTSAAMAGVLIGATPLITLAAATTVLATDKATARRTVGLLIGFVGVVVVVAPWGTEAGTLGGQLAVLGAAASYAAQTVYIRKVLSAKGIAPLALATSQVVVATVLQAVITPFTEWRAPSFTWSIVTSIVILGVVGTGAAYVIYFRLIADLGPTTASAVNYLVPVTAVLISLATLQESITWGMVVGTVIILAGLAVAENRVRLDRPTAARAPSGG